MGRRFRFRQGNGRFKRAPSLEAMGVCWCCDCGKINVKGEDGKLPARCVDCKKEKETQPNGGRTAKENDMPETAEITFPTEALTRLREEFDQRRLGDPKPEGADDSDNDAILRDAIAVIDHLESDNTALRNTIDFMRDRVQKAIEPR